jgi:hypothetical protein
MSGNHPLPSVVNFVPSDSPNDARLHLAGRGGQVQLPRLHGSDGHVVGLAHTDERFQLDWGAVQSVGVPSNDRICFPVA